VLIETEEVGQVCIGSAEFAELFGLYELLPV
jgi:hypothetical protein